MVFVIAGAIAIGCSGQLQLHQYFNSCVGNAVVNALFKFFTFLGDGYFTLAIVFILLFSNVKNALFVLFSYIASGSFTQIFKYSIFDDINRPYFYYSYKGLKLNIVEGVDMHIHNSFPSGHATTAFSLFLCLCLLSKNNRIKLACFFTALLVAFSRVYLSQHFFEDIYAGSIIATVFATLVYYLFYSSSFSMRLEKINQSIFLLFKKIKLDKFDFRNIYFITFFAGILFIPFLGKVHLFDWDEINFAECAREMIITGDYSKVQLNFQPFWEKPPLFIWLQAICMNIFGVTEFAARLPNAICGILTLNILYFIGKKIYNQRFALLWVLVYAGTFLSHFYFKTGIIDPWFNLFIFLGIYYAILHTNNPVGGFAYKSAVLAGVFIGLAILTKGPAGLLIFGLTAGVYWVKKRFAPVTSFKYILAFLIALSITGFSWFLILLINGHGDIIKEFIVYQIRLFNTKDSGHGGFLLYHFVILLIGCFPSTIFFILSHKKSGADSPFQQHVKLWMQVLFWVVLILFTIVKTKIIHYSSMCWLPLSFLATYAIHHLIQKEFSFKKWMTGLTIGIASLLAIVFMAIPLIDKFKFALLQPGVINDAFARENISAHVVWNGYEWLIGLLFIAGIVYFTLKIPKKPEGSIIRIYVTCTTTVSLLAIVLVPKIEAYSQGAAIEFYQTLKDKDCYVETFGFKSYAYLFYTNKRKELNSAPLLEYAKQRGEKDAISGENDPDLSFNRYAMDWMMGGPVDKPTYIVSKIFDEEVIAKNAPGLKVMYRKNGFVFYERLPGE